MFKITGNKGFHITFENGYTVSVQFGPWSYCDNYDMSWENDSLKRIKGVKGIESSTAECAVWGTEGVMLEFDDWGGDTVSNHSTPAEVLELLNWAAKQ